MNQCVYHDLLGSMKFLMLISGGMEIREFMTCVFIFDLRGSGFTQSEITPEFHNSSGASRSCCSGSGGHTRLTNSPSSELIKDAIISLCAVDDILMVSKCWLEKTAMSSITVTVASTQGLTLLSIRCD